VNPPDHSSRAQRWPAFDGVRGLAVLAVICFHVYPSFFKGGYTGVDVFFVLSGFLITSLLTAEYDKYADISFGKFYARRALRLLPALAVVMIAAVVLVFAFGKLEPFRHETLIGLPFVAFYVGNWAIVVQAAALGVLSITWTLAIEEQYYLLWPLVLSRLLRRLDRQHLAYTLIGLAAVEMVVRLVLSYSNVSYNVITYSTATHSDGLLLGSGLGLLWSMGGAWRLRSEIARRANALTIVGIAVPVLVLFFGTPSLHKVNLWVAVAVVATGLLLLGLVSRDDGLMNRVMELPPLLWVGKRAYGFYLWHYPIFLVVYYEITSIHSHIHLVQLLLVLAGTFVVAGLSYRFVERPFLDRKARFSRVQLEASTS